MAPSEPTHVEVERKFVVDDAHRIDLSTVSGVDWVREVPAVELAAVYYDTPDLRLVRLGVELRRRSGGHDAGWHLKVPVKADEKIEIRAPLDDGDAEVPDQLAEAVLGLTGDGHLLPAATVETRRRESELVAEGGRTLAVVAVDEVEAQRLIPTPGRAIQWHEVEVELVDGPPKMMKRVARRLGDAGAEPAPWASKVGRVLDLPDPGRGTRSSTPTTAGDVVLSYLSRHVTALLLGDVAVRTRQPEGIHDMRVATRRLRSTLATFRPFLDGPRWEAARAELKWIGRLLGGVRDLDVLEARLLAEIDDQESLLVIGPVRARTRRELRAQRRDALEALDDALHSDRHLALLDELSSLVADPPLRKAAARKPARAVPARRPGRAPGGEGRDPGGAGGGRPRARRRPPRGPEDGEAGALTPPRPSGPSAGSGLAAWRAP